MPIDNKGLLLFFLMYMRAFRACNCEGRGFEKKGNEIFLCRVYLPIRQWYSNQFGSFLVLIRSYIKNFNKSFAKIPLCVYYFELGRVKR